MKPFVSVIIPTYNRLELLKKTVVSVRSQSFRDFEIIVINDGSSDGTAEWLAEQHDVIGVNQPNSGIASSRNKGISASKGEWLAFLDHDDIWAPDKLQTQVDFVRANPQVGMVAVKHVRLGTRISRTGPWKWIKGDLFVKVFSESFIHTSSVMIGRDVLEKVGGFPTRYRFADEFDVWLKISKKYEIAFFDRPLVFIRFYDSNTSHNRIGVRSDTYEILMSNYDTDRIPRKIYLKTLSDHDISFGRAYVNLGDFKNAMKWFKSAVRRTPLRTRAWRYYIRYKILSIFKRSRPGSQNA
ncbi:MAG: glycosyltransferase [Syntrophaceae bacterium]|nr:glycosyltransferase [Syntrophaceae bacterium]